MLDLKSIRKQTIQGRLASEVERALDLALIEIPQHTDQIKEFKSDVSKNQHPKLMVIVLRDLKQMYEEEL